MTRFFSRRSATRRAGPRRRLILLYHRVATPLHDPFDLAIAPDAFRAQLEFVATSHQLVGVDELLDADPADPTPLAAVTFDDGYRDNLTIALPILRDLGVPAMVFVCTGALGDRRGFWWDRIASAVTADGTRADDLRDLDGLRWVDELARAKSGDEIARGVAAHLRPMRPTERDQVVVNVEDRLSAAVAAREAHPVMDEAEVRSLHSDGLVQVGAHTRSHPMLSRLTRDEQLDEMARSVATINEVTGTAPEFLAYPYGGAGDYDDDSCDAARQLGLRAAFVNHSGPFDPRGAPFRIPRLYMPPMEGASFRAWFARSTTG